MIPVCNGFAVGELLFFACPKKSNQKKRHPMITPFGFPHNDALSGERGPRKWIWALRSNIRVLHPESASLFGAIKRGVSSFAN